MLIVHPNALVAGPNVMLFAILLPWYSSSYHLSRTDEALSPSDEQEQALVALADAVGRERLVDLELEKFAQHVNRSSTSGAKHGGTSRDSPSSWAVAGNGTSESGRAWLCDRERQLSTKTVKPEDALKNKRIRLATSIGYETAYIYRDPNEQSKYSGYMWAVVQELQRRGGFEVEIVDHPLGEKDIDTWVSETATVHDAVILPLASTTDREHNLLFPVYGLFDSRLVLVTHASSDWGVDWSWKTLLMVWKPFSVWVWLAMMIMAIVSAGVYWIIEHRTDEDLTPFDRKEGLAHALFTHLFQLTQLDNLHPKTWPGRIILMSWAVFGVVIVCSYTAAVASALVANQEAMAPWKDLDEVIGHEANICVGPHGSRFMKENFPSYEHLIEGSADKSSTPMQSLLEKTCDAALVSLSTYQINMEKKEYNPDCTLSRVGYALDDAYNGWTVYAESTDKCTNVVRITFEELFTQMEHDGTLRRLWDDVMLPTERTLLHECSAPETGNANIVSLSFRSMSSIFVTHFMVVIAALSFFAATGGGSALRMNIERALGSTELPERDEPSQLRDQTEESQLPAKDEPRQLPDETERSQLPGGEQARQLPDETGRSQLPEGEETRQLPDQTEKSQLPGGNENG